MRGYCETITTPPIKIKVLDERCVPEQHGDWCDLKVYDLIQAITEPRLHFYASLKGTGSTGYEDQVALNNNEITYKAYSIFKVSLGVAMQIPEGYHAQVVPRSSTRKHFGVMLTNSIGIIDNSYNGDNDIWMAEFYALQDGEMKIGDRILQFRLVKNGDPIQFERVESLGNQDRGGFGSTGK